MTKEWVNEIEKEANIDDETIECCAVLSTAISLKRIADILLLLGMKEIEK